MLRHFVIVTATLAFTSCNVQVDGSEFAHSQNSGNRPWTHEQFDASSDKFTFAVFSDLTGNERDRVFEIAVAQLNLLRPELIINVGDLIEGGTEDLDDIDAQWDSFDERAERAHAPGFMLAETTTCRVRYYKERGKLASGHATIISCTKMFFSLC